MSQCPICQRKVGGFTGMLKADSDSITYAKKCGIDVPDSVCGSCLGELFSKIDEKKVKSRTELIEDLERSMSEIRITTYPPSENDEYVYCGLATATAAIGTGPISQLLSSWTDFFGEESGSYNEKLRAGERSCMAKIRKRAIEIGGNAVAGAQFTYTELTSGHGMILVCIAGTVINDRSLPQDIGEKYKKLLAEIEIPKA